MQKGDIVETPRFLKVRIEEILDQEEAYNRGYTEPTHYNGNPDYDVLGRVTKPNHMAFAAVRKTQN